MQTCVVRDAPPPKQPHRHLRPPPTLQFNTTIRERYAMRREEEAEARRQEELAKLPIRNDAADLIKQFYDDFLSLRLDRNRSRVVRVAGRRLMRTVRRLQLRVQGFLAVQAARRLAFSLLFRRVEIRERFAIMRCERILLARHKRTHEKDETVKTEW